MTHWPTCRNFVFFFLAKTFDLRFGPLPALHLLDLATDKMYLLRKIIKKKLR